MTKKVIREIHYCNDHCPHFYHNFEDSENCWCNKLDKKVYDYDDASYPTELSIFDTKERPIPEDCPLDCVGFSMNSTEIIGRSRERFEELNNYEFEWRSFYNGWLEGRFDMLRMLNERENGRLSRII